MRPERKLLIGYDRHLAPGDYTILTPLIRDLATTYGNRYAIGVATNMSALFQGNPHISRLDASDPSVEHVILGYKPGMDAAGQGEKVHFTNWMYRDFFAKTRIQVPQLKAGCDFYLNQKEKQYAPISGRYWLIFGGGKTDFVTKHWDFDWYQAVVNGLRPLGFRFAQTGSAAEGHVHPRIKNALNLVGWGYLRELIWQIAHCEGVICPITCGMHIASAFNKPCVVIAGGREEPWWEAYDNAYGQFGPHCEPVPVPHRYLHTLGTFDCCKYSGCWTNKLRLMPGSRDNKICKKLADREPGQQELPACMDMIKPQHVIDAVLSYYKDGTLPPINLDNIEIPEPQVLAREVPWQPVVNQPTESPIELAPRRAGLRWSHPKLGSKLTVCVYLSPKYKCEENIACLKSILNTVPRVRLELFIGYVQLSEPNKMTPAEIQLGSKTLLYVREFCSFAKTFTGSSRQDLMKHMLSAAKTRYAAWIEGNCKAVHNDWLNLLGEHILKQIPGTAAFGVKRDLAMVAETWQLRRQKCMDSQFFAIRADAAGELRATTHGLILTGNSKIAPFNMGKSLVFYPPPPDNSV